MVGEYNRESAHALTQAMGRDRHRQRARPEAAVVEGLARAGTVLPQQREPEHELTHSVDPGPMRIASGTDTTGRRGP